MYNRSRQMGRRHVTWKGNWGGGKEGRGKKNKRRKNGDKVFVKERKGS